MAYTQADIDALDEQIRASQAVKATTMGDQSTTFRDVDEMLKLRAVMVAQVTASTGRSRTRLAATRKGI